METDLPISERLKGIDSSSHVLPDQSQEEHPIIESSANIELIISHAGVPLGPESPNTAGVVENRGLSGVVGELTSDQSGSTVIERTQIEKGSAPPVPKESFINLKIFYVGSLMTGVREVGLEVSTLATTIPHCPRSPRAGLEIRESTPSSNRTAPPHQIPSFPRPERPSTRAPSSRLPLKVSAQRARYIMTNKMNEFLNICLLQCDMKIEQLEKEIQEFEHTRVDPTILEEMRNQASAAAIQNESYQDRISSLGLEL